MIIHCLPSLDAARELALRSLNCRYTTVYIVAFRVRNESDFTYSSVGYAVAVGPADVIRERLLASDDQRTRNWGHRVIGDVETLRWDGGRGIKV